MKSMVVQKTLELNFGGVVANSKKEPKTSLGPITLSLKGECSLSPANLS